MAAKRSHHPLSYIHKRSPMAATSPLVSDPTAATMSTGGIIATTTRRFAKLSKNCNSRYFAVVAVCIVMLFAGVHFHVDQLIDRMLMEGVRTASLQSVGLTNFRPRPITSQQQPVDSAMGEQSGVIEYAYGNNTSVMYEYAGDYDRAEPTSNEHLSADVLSTRDTHTKVRRTARTSSMRKKSSSIDHQTKQVRKKRPRDPYNYVVNIQPEWGVPGLWDEKYIEIMPTNKILLKKDRRVVFPHLGATRQRTGRGSHSPVDSEDASIASAVPVDLTETQRRLRRHPLYGSNRTSDETLSLEDVMELIKWSPACARKPVFITLATAKTDLYWQLIENFVYTLAKFDQSDCALVICVSDGGCMRKCEEATFPCFNYESADRPLPSVMEQIAQVKLLHIPRVLGRGVDVFLLDLDVGFLESPAHMVEAFYGTPIVDIMVQEDYIFIMNRTKAGWGTYFTEPLPNIGLFLCRGNNRTARVFELAWEKYSKVADPYEKSLPGKDQMHVLDGMRIGRGTFGLKYAYFSHDSAPLLDKLVLERGNTVELGGEAIADMLFDKRSIAMHSTCYEKSTKVMGLKASNAFWNPKYYAPLRPTITKQLLYVDDKQLLDEVRSLVWLSIVTKRSLIIPNVLASQDIRQQEPYRNYKEQLFWPGFRVLYLKTTDGQNDLAVEVLEPAFYWRVSRDYADIPSPTVIYFKPDDDLATIADKLALLKESPRVVVHYDSYSFSTDVLDAQQQQQLRRAAELDVQVWANDSVGLHPRPYAEQVQHYQRLPSVKTIRGLQGLAGSELVERLISGMRTCNGIFGPLPGSRNCFKICQ